MDRTVLHIVAIAVCLTSAVGIVAGAVNVVPLPVTVEERAGAFVIEPSTHVIAEGEAAIEATKLIESLGGRNASTILEALGYQILWRGISPETAEVRKK